MLLQETWISVGETALSSADPGYIHLYPASLKIGRNIIRVKALRGISGVSSIAWKEIAMHIQATEKVKLRLRASFISDVLRLSQWGHLFPLHNIRISDMKDHQFHPLSDSC